MWASGLPETQITRATIINQSAARDENQEVKFNHLGAFILTALEAGIIDEK
jgi:hypothetical protein